MLEKNDYLAILSYYENKVQSFVTEDARKQMIIADKDKKISELERKLEMAGAANG